MTQAPLIDEIARDGAGWMLAEAPRREVGACIAAFAAKRPGDPQLAEAAAAGAA